MYADDTTLFATLNPSSEMEMQYQIINRELEKIQQWLNVNKLSLNIEKSKFMIFSMPKKKIDIPKLKLAGTEIESVEHFNFIGITVDKHRGANTNRLICKMSKTTGILNRLKQFLPQQILKIIYASLILCYINYGIMAWVYNLNRAYIMQKRALRIITCSKYNVHTMPILKDLNLLKIEDIFKLHQLKLYYKLVNKQLPAYFDSITWVRNNERDSADLLAITCAVK